jgi:hypothetical protein
LGSFIAGGGYFQKHQDLNGDDWADVASYGRGVVRPRFYWHNQNGATALLTGGTTIEDRTGGTKRISNGRSGSCSLSSCKRANIGVNSARRAGKEIRYCLLLAM